MASANQFVSIAAAEVGNGPSKYNTGGQPWCAIFVNWCFRQCGDTRQGTAAACSFANMGTLHHAGDGYTPQPGDLLIVNLRGDHSWADHVAIVKSYADGMIRAINGNGVGNVVTDSSRPYSSKITIVAMEWSGGESSESEKEANFYDQNEKITLHSQLFSMPEMAGGNEISIYCGLHDVTKTLGSLSWENTKKELATKLSFSLAKSDTRYQNIYLPQKGDILRLFLCGTEMFRGVILSDDTGSRHSNAYTAADAGWYLNKTTDTYQFKDAPAEATIRKILSDLSVPIAYIDAAAMANCLVTELYIDKCISEVLWNILEKIGGDWNFDFIPSGIRIYKIGAFAASPKFRVSQNTEYKDSVTYRGAETASSSIEDRKTAVKVISDTETLACIRDDAAWAQYGFLQEVVKQEKEDGDPWKTAETKLAERNRDSTSRSFPMVVELQDNTRAGDILYVDGTAYQITSAQHEIKKNRHHVTVELEGIGS